ncbi:MAG: helix-turn-helix transcriptional regulator [Alkalimonas sp.]|nr:helix-turn-helix transcriptional regulator [Alkalimonas sp.]
MNNFPVEARNKLLLEIDEALAANQISLGEAVRRIRTELYGMTQTQYAKFIKVSDKTLRDIEKGNTDPRLSVLGKVLAPGGFQVSARFFKRSI